MRRWFVKGLILLFISVGSAGCYTSRKNQSELRGLMLQESLHLKRNRAFYSKHNQKTMKQGYKRYKKYNRFR